MGDLLANLDWPRTATLAVFALASGGSALIEASKHLVRACHQWRLDRRLARNPYILREELNEYRFRIDDDLPPLDLHRLVGSSLYVGVLAAIPTWFAERHLEQWWHYITAACFVFILLTRVWRRLNDPPEMHARAGPPEVTVPREAWLGLVGGIAMAALILLFALLV